jgi:hypothetical protein
MRASKNGSLPTDVHGKRMGENRTSIIRYVAARGSRAREMKNTHFRWASAFSRLLSFMDRQNIKMGW